MEMNDEQIEIFKRFAENRLRNHQMSLSTRYGGQNVETRELLNRAYSDHRKIFENELDEEINTLADKNPWLQTQLNTLKTQFVVRLNNPDA